MLFFNPHTLTLWNRNISCRGDLSVDYYRLYYLYTDDIPHAGLSNTHSSINDILEYYVPISSGNLFIVLYSVLSDIIYARTIFEYKQTYAEPEI